MPVSTMQEVLVPRRLYHLPCSLDQILPEYHRRQRMLMIAATHYNEEWSICSGSALPLGLKM